MVALDWSKSSSTTTTRIGAVTNPRQAAQTRFRGWLYAGIAGVAVMALALVLAMDLAEANQTALRRMVGSEGELTRIEVIIQLDARIDSLDRMAKFWSASALPIGPAWDDYALAIMKSQVGYRAIALISSDLEIDRIVTADGQNSPLDYAVAETDQQRAVLFASSERERTVLSGVLECANGGQTIHACSPMIIRSEGTSRCVGWVVGVFRIPLLLDEILASEVTRGYCLAVADEYGEFFRTYSGDTSLEDTWAVSEDISLRGKVWRLRTWPSAELLASRQSSLPVVVILGGATGALMVALLVALMFRVKEQRDLLDIKVASRTRELLESSERIQVLLDSTAEAIFGTDATRRCIFANASCARLLGFSGSNDLIGMDMLAVLHGSDWEAERQTLPLAQVLFRTLDDGSEGHVDDVQFRRVHGPEFRAEAWCHPLHRGGIVMGSVVTFLDVTQRKLQEEELTRHRHHLEVLVEERSRELEHAHAQLRQAQKLEAVGTLAGGIAHDFNNLLLVINGYSQTLLSGDRVPGTMEREAISEIAKAGQRAASLVNQLLAFSRKQVLKPQVINLNVVIDDTVTMLRRLIGANIELRVKADPMLEPVLIDPGQIQQVLTNLAVNARDAMPDGGTLTIATSNTSATLESKGYSMANTEGRYVCVRVSDTGVGMNAKVIEHIFEPFFTTKGPGKGTGLGLATVHGIVKQSRGMIEVQSEEGRGTTFSIFLPRHQGERVDHSTDKVKTPLLGNETVLLAEDEASVRRFIASELCAAGFTVIEASNGSEALAIAERMTEPLDVLLTDVVMPVMGGPELSEHIRGLHPNVAIVFMSGYTFEADIVDQHATDVAFVQKPCSPQKIIETIRRTMDCEVHV